LSDILFDGGGEYALLIVVYCFIFPDSGGGYAVEFDGLFIYYLHYASNPCGESPKAQVFKVLLHMLIHSFIHLFL